MNNIENNEETDQYFNSILEKHKEAAEADSDIVDLTELMYLHMDELPKDMPDETIKEFKDIIVRIVPGRSADVFFEIIDKNRKGIEYDTQDYMKRFLPVELNLVMTVLLYAMVLIYEKDISDEYRMQMKNVIVFYGMFVGKSSNDSCCIL
jgi:hypothetical protein